MWYAIGIIIAILAIIALVVLFVRSRDNDDDLEVQKLLDKQERELLALFRRQGRESSALATIGSQAMAEEAASFLNPLAPVAGAPAPTLADRLNAFFSGRAGTGGNVPLTMAQAEESLAEIHETELSAMQARHESELTRLRQIRKARNSTTT